MRLIIGLICQLACARIAACMDPPPPAPREDVAGNTPRRVMVKTVQMDGNEYEVEVVALHSECTLIGSNGTRSDNLLDCLEAHIRPLVDDKATRQRVWRKCWLAAGSGTIIGRPVVDATVWEHDKQSAMLIALANDYYYWKNIYKVDPRITVPDMRDVYVQGKKGEWTPKSPLTSDVFLEVPTRGIERALYGTRNIAILAREDTITLSVEYPKGVPGATLKYNVNTHQWTKEEHTDERPAGVDDPSK